MVECAPLLVCSNPTWIDVIRQNYQRKIVHTYHEPAKPPVYANENCVRLKLQNISVQYFPEMYQPCTCPSKKGISNFP
ncbi:hypothetical protein QE152_g30722 [Popillia japonica]|uniref:Uncharacterized protein n=1 Tax=Popillia japonica TaxID=7064 RepID=A0AAW1JDY6_POPJA